MIKYFFIYMLLSLHMTFLWFNTVYGMEDAAPPSCTPSCTVPSLKELCAKKIKEGINWEKKPTRQITKIYKQNIPEDLWSSISKILISSTPPLLSSAPLLYDVSSSSADGSIGVTVSNYNKRKKLITIINDKGAIGSFTQKRSLQVLMSLDGRYILTLKNKQKKNVALIKIWSSKNQTCIGTYQFPETLESISCVDNTNHIKLIVDKKTQYITTVKSLLSKGIATTMPLEPKAFAKLILMRPDEITKQKLKKFYDIDCGVWNAKNPQNLFKNFIALESSFENKEDPYDYFYLHTNPSGTLLAHGDSNGIITIWDIEKKEIVRTFQLETKEPVKRISWRTHDKITAITQKNRYQFDIRDLLVGFFLKKAIEQNDQIVTPTIF